VDKDDRLIFEAAARNWLDNLDQKIISTINSRMGKSVPGTHPWNLQDLTDEAQTIQGQHAHFQIEYLRPIINNILDSETVTLFDVRKALEASKIDPTAIKTLLNQNYPYMGQVR